MGHFNVRSLVHRLINKWDVFKTQFESSNIHVLGLSESWVNDSLTSNLCNLSADHILIQNERCWAENDPDKNIKGDGVGIFIDSKLELSDFC